MLEKIWLVPTLPVHATSAIKKVPHCADLYDRKGWIRKGGYEAIAIWTNRHHDVDMRCY